MHVESQSVPNLHEERLQFFIAQDTNGYWYWIVQGGSAHSPQSFGREHFSNANACIQNLRYYAISTGIKRILMRSGVKAIRHASPKSAGRECALVT